MPTPLAETPEDGRQRLAPLSLAPCLLTSSAEWGLGGSFRDQPLHLPELLIFGVWCAEEAMRELRGKTVLPEAHSLLVPAAGRALALSADSYEALALELALRVEPYLEGEEREARELARELESALGGLAEGRPRALSLAHAVWNRASSQAAYALAGAASAYGADNVRRTLPHLFKALVAVDAAGWREPLIRMASRLTGLGAQP